MIDAIFKEYMSSNFDFRHYANPDDPYSFDFDQMLECYRFKHALCKVIEPKSILVVGLGQSYTPATLIHAYRDASIVCIENDKSYLTDWVKENAKGANVEFVVTDDVINNNFRSRRFNLINIDGLCSGDRTWQELETSFGGGDWILVDRYFKSKEIMQCTSQFMFKYRAFIEYSMIVPIYPGELLIKVKDSAKAFFGRQISNYQHLDKSYDSEYYLTDCGGYDSFKKYHGRTIEDPRLLTVISLASIEKGQKILDLGCGRGELAYAMANNGASITAVDYSNDAIDIARKTYENEKLDLEFIHGDFLALSFQKKFDRIIASDVVEHLEQPMLAKMFAKVADLILDDGLFIIHTAPNKLNLEYTHRQKRKIAAQIGCYLPKNPRTYYEDLMHLNEQTPARLNRSLRKHFPHVVTWTTNLPDPIGGLIKPLTRCSLRDGSSLFAIASKKPIDINKLLHKLRPDIDISTDIDQQLTVKSTPRACQLQSHIIAAEFSADVGAEVTPMESFTGVTRVFARFAGKLVVYLSSFITARQRAFNRSVIDALKLLANRNESTGSSSVERFEAGEMLRQITDSKLEVAEHEKPLTTQGDFHVSNHNLSPWLNSVESAERHSFDEFYVAFEENFRGTRKEIQKRLEVYLPIVSNLLVDERTLKGALLDIGCGRGEWLELLRVHGYRAKGVDTNRVALSICRDAGLDVEESDALEYIKLLNSETCSLITGFHLVEHMPIDIILMLTREAFRVLKPGGALILETPDPENVIVATRNFYIDPTHRNPIPDVTLAFILEYSGFVGIEILKLQKISNPSLTNNQYQDEVLRRFFTSQDYGLICYKPK